MGGGGGYCVVPFRREIGITQAGSLLSTIFNVIVETVFRHWESLLVDAMGGGAKASTIR